MRRMLRAGVIFSLLALVYCLLALAQAVWLSATPNFPEERTRLNLQVWGGGTLLFLFLEAAFAAVLCKTRQRNR